MKNLRNRFERFCFRNSRKGIPNLMLYISLGAGVVYLMWYLLEFNPFIYYWLAFDRALILKGQVWRLFTYPLVYGVGDLNMVLVLISLLCYYSLGRAMEQVWGTLRFNLYYFSGILLMDIFCLIFGGQADVYYLNLSLFLGYATLYPDSHFLLFFIIPVKAWIFAVLDLALVLYGLITYPFPVNLFSVISLANYFLFFGKDIVNVFPMSWRVNAGRLFRKKRKQTSKTIPFPSGVQSQKPADLHTHRCTVCGRTDISNPDLEFRYCSRCAGYHCFCIDHIQNHEHYE